MSRHYKPKALEQQSVSSKNTELWGVSIEENAFGFDPKEDGALPSPLVHAHTAISLFGSQVD